MWSDAVSMPFAESMCCVHSRVIYIHGIVQEVFYESDKTFVVFLCIFVNTRLYFIGGALGALVAIREA